MTDLQKETLINKMSDNLKTLRTKLNLSQEELGDVIGLSRYTIMDIEKKKSKMTWNTFMALVFLFSKNVETDKMLTLFEIYTDELNNMLKMKSTEEYSCD